MFTKTTKGTKIEIFNFYNEVGLALCRIFAKNGDEWVNTILLTDIVDFAEATAK